MNFEQNITPVRILKRNVNSDHAIETTGLEKVYRSRWRGREIRAVSDLSLRVPIGVKFGLLGANGAGKTTFVKMLLSAVNPTAGSAAIFGKDARDPESRRPVGYLPENHRFPTYFTGSGMLHFYGSLSGMDWSDRKRRVPELLDQVGLKDWGDVRIRKFSKGMLQRLGLAQALIHRPRLLVLDEPTDGVDPVGRRHIRDVLSALTDAGVTIFINSHLLSEVETFCDYVAILKKGRLALEGKMGDLLTGRGYRLTGRTGAGDIIDRQLPTREEANRLIDQIRASSGWIESVTPSVSSLEDVFIRTAGDDKAA
jgi:ABC-2 type transport system ATP-binding protein